MEEKEKKQNILLESGTNEIEIMEFTIGNAVFGINVAKVSEIMRTQPVSEMPCAHPAVEGVFKPRDLVITVVNLPKYLGFPENSSTSDKELFILTNFNNMHIAFHVHTVVGINRISWQQIEKPDNTIYGGQEGVVTGITEYEKRLITILDFEKIVADISPETSIKLSDLDELGERKDDNRPVLVVEDSILLSKMIVESLHKAGYKNTIMKSNGQEAWDFLCSIREDPDLTSKVSIIITDIEMPKMDGHRLTKLVKEDRYLKRLPLIIFSSLITDEMRIKGKQLGADEQLSKPEIAHLVDVIDHLLYANR